MSALITKTCRHCQRSFEVYQSKVAQGKGEYCSKECFYAFRQNSRPRQAVCRHCGKAFKASPHRIENGEARYCGRKCFRLSQDRDLETYLWSQVEKSDACWLWHGPINSGNGYGRFSFNGQALYAHRVSYELSYGPIPDGRNICHHCDNPPCVRPDHLFLGTQKENTDDRDSKDRVRHGEEHVNAKLTETDVIAIRQTYAAGQISMRALATRHGVSYATIHEVVQRITWKRVP